MKLRPTAILVVLSFAASLSLPAKSQVNGPPALFLGTAWYPEQWPETRWDADLALMEQAHIRFVRIGEFAWSNMEPTEGNYDLSWLSRAIRMAEKHHIYVVLGTPTATPPAWMTQKYPEILRTKEDGQKDGHGNRQQFDFSSPKYRELAHDIAARMAERFGQDRDVIGWQIDNEYANASYGETTRKQFQDWLKTRYGTLTNLNARWTTAYWSESYTDWSQIPIQINYGNPGLLLSWKRFVSDTWRSYQKNQIDAIRTYAGKNQFITTNMMGWFDAYDHYTVSQDLDMASWDDYVGHGHLDPIYNGAAHDLTRGFLRKNFWVMETQPGFVNWASDNNSLDKGEVRAMAWHDIGHGADAVGYWQWRSALNGQEEYHGTLLGADGTPVPLYPEVAQIGLEFGRASLALAGTAPHAEVAILHSYDSRWAVNWQRHNQAFDPIQALLGYYKPLRDLAHTIDIVNPSVPLTPYKLVVAPALNLITDEQAKNLIAYVNQGGHLVFGPRSGMKDIDNSLQPMRQPGPLVPQLGGRVEQYYALEHDVPVTGDWGTGTSKLWAEQLSTTNPDTTKVLMRYGKSNGWLDGMPAAITHQVGKGSITYIGAELDAATLAKAAKWMIEQSGIQQIPVDLPEGVELSIRTRGAHTVWILINFGKAPATIKLPYQMMDVLSLSTAKLSTVTLDRYGVSVLSMAVK
jgi:beta-galactosidase